MSRELHDLDRRLGAKFKEVDRNISNLHRAIQAINANSGNRMNSNELERWVSEQRTNEERYANTILLLGYGGFFVLWSSIHGRMPNLLFGICGLLALISLLLFVTWELVKTLVSGLATNRATKHVGGNRVHASNQIVEIMISANDKVNRHWLWFFVPSVIAGLTAGGLLIYSYAVLTF